MNLQEHMASYLSTQRTTARATQEQEGVRVDDAGKGTVDRMADAIVEGAKAREGKWRNVTIVEFPRTGDEAREALAAVLANAKGGRRLWHDA